ncbi:MAG: hypothetical protein ACOCP8_00180 [archaeon]
MKRLIKKSEFYLGFKDRDDNYYEIFINPALNEINKIKKENNYDSIRGIIYENEIVIIWSGNIIHDQINNYIEQSIDVTNCFRFAYEGYNNWSFDGYHTLTAQQIYNKIIENKNFLEKIYNLDSGILLRNGIDFDSPITAFNIEHLDKKVKRHYQKKVENNMKRLLKKAKIMNIGFVGYSGTKFIKKDAKEIIENIFDEIDKEFTGYVNIISGATDMGIPKLVYEEARYRGHKLIGVMCKEGYECELFDVDKLIVKGEKWGDESQTFLNMLDRLYRIGGGPQSLEETKQSKQMGIQVIEYELSSIKDNRGINNGKIN